MLLLLGRERDLLIAHTAFDICWCPTRGCLPPPLGYWPTVTTVVIYPVVAPRLPVALPLVFPPRDYPTFVVIWPLTDYVWLLCVPGCYADLSRYPLRLLCWLLFCCLLRTCDAFGRYRYVTPRFLPYTFPLRLDLRCRLHLPIAPSPHPRF